VTIRPEGEGDHAAVEALVGNVLGIAEARLVARLRTAGDAVISLVAERDGAVVGHILFSPMRAPFRALGLGPLAVDPDSQRQGIGGALVGEGLSRAAAGGWDGVFVLGDPAYYTRFGFSAAGAAGFTCRYAGPHLMLLALREPLPAREGPVAYAPAFDALEE